MLETRKTNFSSEQNLLSLFARVLKRKLFYIPSFPRSGRNWVVFFVAAYLNRLHGATFEEDFKVRRAYTCPARPDRIWEARLPQAVWKSGAPIMLLTHMHAHKRTRLLNFLPLVVLVRNPYDCLVSNYHMQSQNKQKFEGSMEMYLSRTPGDERKLLPLERWIDFYNSWAAVETRHRDFAVFSYEQLNSNPEEHFQRLIEFMNVPVEKDVLRQALEATGLENLKARELALENHPKLERKRVVRDARIVRRGVTGGFRQELAPQMVEKLHGLVMAGLTPTAQDFLKRSGVELDPAAYPEG